MRKAKRLVASLLAGLASLGASAPSTTLRGYTPAGSQRERQTENRFIDIPTTQDTLAIATAFGVRMHEAGTGADYGLAVDMRDRMRADGINADLEPLTAQVDSARKLSLELAPPADLAALPAAGGRRRRAAFPIRFNLAEAAEPTDPATLGRGIGVPFNAGSADGDVSAPLVYAARGLDDDYALLARAGIDVRGAVVLVRYGAQFRGLLAQHAQDHGAAAVIFYSDPLDEGPSRGAAYPNGPWRPLTAVERGWVGPGIRIPTLPISAANATILLRSLSGAAGPPAWGGSLPADYPLARGPGRVHLVVKLDRRQVTLWNTIGVIPGVRDDQNIILGAQRDAWVYGVGDNGSGITTVLEVARGLGTLLQSGWRPARTIVLAGWDGEENGFAGSDAFAALHRRGIGERCFAYLSADETVTGSAFFGGASAALSPLIVDAAQLVRDPLAPAQSVYARWAAQTPNRAPQPDAGGNDRAALPSAAGTPSAAMRFAGPFGVYHSADDTLAYALRWSDPDFGLHRAAAQLYGVVALRIADAAVVPYSFAAYTPLLRQSLTRFGARAKTAGISLNLRPTQRAIEHFARVAAAVDRGVPGGNDDAGTSVRGLRAARELDTLLSGPAGFARAALPDADAALRAGDAVNRAAGDL